MKRFFIPLAMIILSQLVAMAQNQFAGKCGETLKQFVQDTYMPSDYLSSATGDGGAWSVFAQCDINADGSVLDRYSTNKYYYPQDRATAPVGLNFGPVVDFSWWGTFITDAIKWDLYNLLPCNIDVLANKCDYMPGVPSDIKYDNGVWSMGIVYIYETPVNVYMPPKGYEGDFARIIMYMATIYPAERWSGQGVNFFADCSYPTLNGYSKNLLLQWHESDPVSDVERLRNEVISMVQGNRNPFVDYPYLPDYIWGTKSSEPYQPEQDDSGVTKIPLRATYSLSADSRVDLYSPYIPDDATWSVNGIEVIEKSIETKWLGVGDHELRFESDLIKGKLKIKIVE